MTKFKGFQKYAYKKQKPGFALRNFLDTSNPLELFANKKVVLGIVSLALIVAGVVLYQGPLFHSSQTNPAFPGNDPNTKLWDASGDSGNLADFNSVLTTYDGTSPHSIDLNPNSTTTAVALTKSPMDLSTVSGKMLSMFMAFKLKSGSCCGSGAFGFYFTTNSSLPLSTNYDPGNDKQVAFITEAFSTGGGNFEYDTLIQRAVGSSINSEKVSGCTGSSSSFFLCNGNAIALSNQIQVNPILNFTGQANSGGCSANGIGNGCSSLGVVTLPLPPSSSAYVSTQTSPPLQFQAVQYYIGFFATGTGYVPQFYYDTGALGALSMWIGILTINITTPLLSPTIDTGGFFGPIIRALISIGVFIFANIISFGNYLGGLLGPVWDFFGGLANSVVQAVGGFVITLMNSLGGLIGDPNLGTQLVNVFTSIGSYITGVFAGIGAIVTNFITFIQNGLTILFDGANGIITYWLGTVILGIFGVLITISNIIVTVLKVFQVGFPFVVLADMLWLLSESIDHGTEGAMKWWGPHEILVINVGKLMFILIETLSTFIYQTIVEIEGGVADLKPEIGGFSP